MQSTVASLLARQFGAEARIVESSAAHPAVDALRAYFEGDLGALDAIAVDPAGTPFQQRVWQALCAIPAGQTLSYSELALRLGMPTGARAVASAVAANPIAVAVPCHRVVRNDGSISGYRWGVERKRALLLREARQAQEASGKDAGHAPLRQAGSA